MIKLLIFDFDGTVIDTYPSRFEAFHRATKSVGKVFSKKELEKRLSMIAGRGSFIELKHLLSDSPHLWQKARKVYDKFHDTPSYKAKIKLFDGVKETLESLSKKYALTITSGIRRKYFDIYTRQFNIHPYFKHAVTFDDVQRVEDLKPSPFMVEEILKRFDVSKDEVLLVGDAKNDILMAQKAGVTPVAVLTGHLTKKEAEELGVKYILPDLTHLESLLEKIGSKTY